MGGDALARPKSGADPHGTGAPTLYAAPPVAPAYPPAPAAPYQVPNAPAYKPAGPGAATPQAQVQDARAVRPLNNPGALPLPRPGPPPPILIATADPAISRMLSFALDQVRLPYRVIASGSVALNELLTVNVGRQRPVVVLDVDLPGVDGHAILERLGSKRPDTFLILVLSSHADESVQVRSLLAGAVDHLAKPFNVRVLSAKIQRWTAVAAHLAGTG